MRYFIHLNSMDLSAGDRFELPLPDHESSMQPLHQPAFDLIPVQGNRI